MTETLFPVTDSETAAHALMKLLSSRQGQDVLQVTADGKMIVFSGLLSDELIRPLKLLLETKNLLGPNYAVGGKEFADQIEEPILPENDCLQQFVDSASTAHPVEIAKPELFANALTRLTHLYHNDARIPTHLRNANVEEPEYMWQLAQSFADFIYTQLLK